jgi:uncharacterized LabA/DUF88 family protein/cold shock CspA family protein
MLKAGIYLDVENLVRCGGRFMRFRVIKDLVEAQGATVLRANAYMARDAMREAADADFRRRKDEYRFAVRKAGFHLVLKDVQRYRGADGEEVSKANADLDLAVDALLQADNLDYVLLGSGDGDFIQLVRALQNRGKRVDVLSFSHTSTELRRQADYHFSGYLMPGVLPMRETPSRLRGTMHGVNEEKGFAFLSVHTGLAVGDQRDDIFLHISDFHSADGQPVGNQSFAALKTREAVIEFDMKEQADGRFKAVNALEMPEPL